MIIKFIWSPVLITILAVVGYFYELPVEIIGPSLLVILIIGSITTAVCLKERKLNKAVVFLKGQGEYFIRRFASDSHLSIFVIINGLNSSDTAVREWLRACNTAQLIFNAWCESFIARIRNDDRNGNIRLYLHTYLVELWSIVSHYHEFVDQFHEVASNSKISDELVEQYNRFTDEYNTFVLRFRDHIGELKRISRTEIEPPSVKTAKELLPVSQRPKEQNIEENIPKPKDNRGYITGKPPI
ncbi:MAG: hypothetical protein JW967_08945 [Dehalococcoidales bacterium]|nr:hypothetical protein [Dehalococcoidales bacterium]